MYFNYNLYYKDEEREQEILEDKERIFINKIKKLVIKNKENKIFYDNERYKLIKVNIQKELQKNEEFKKVS